jgi:hypothetical protein
MRLNQIFALDTSKVNWSLGITVAGALFIPLVVLAALGQDVYWLPVSFGTLYVALSDPGGPFRMRWTRLAIFALIGAVLTAWGVWVGSAAWELVTVSAFAVTLGSGLVIQFGVRRFATGTLLASWFLIAIALPPGFAAEGIVLDPWTQALAWLVGAAVWFVVTSVVWLTRGRTEHAPSMAVIPADTASRALTPPIVLYAVIRAVAVAGAVAVAFGLDLPYADWMPLAALVAMKTDLHQSTLTATQRVVGTILGATIAAVFLLGADSEYVLAVAIVVLAAVGGALRLVNYALYTTGIASAALIALDIANPTDLTTEGLRILFTLFGVGIAIAVSVIAGAIAVRAANRETSG